MNASSYPLVRDWLRICSGKLVLQTGKVELGQRIITALVRIAVEELTIEPDCIDVANPNTSTGLNEGITAGSNSIEQTGQAQRQACATARKFVTSLAAKRLGVANESLDIADGHITCRGSNLKLPVLDLLRDVPDDLRVDETAEPRCLKESIPDIVPRGLQACVEGRRVFVQDLEWPGMLHARIVCPPTESSRLLTVDENLLGRIVQSGLRFLREGSFMAVAGKDEWPVIRAAESLAISCSWDLGQGLETGDVFALMQNKPAEKLPVVNGQPRKGVSSPPPADVDIRACYRRPYTLHGALAPSAALAEWRHGKLRILTHSQGIYPLRACVAESLGLGEEDVAVEFAPSSGCYGHNGADDAALDAALVARAIPNTPILLKYSRSDEHRREPASPAMSVRVEAKLNEKKHIETLWMESRGSTHLGRPRIGLPGTKQCRLVSNATRMDETFQPAAMTSLGSHVGLHRNLDPLYTIPDKRLSKAFIAGLPLRTSALRCLGATANIFAIESMMDELAATAGLDPIEFRLRHLDDQRSVAVLTALRDAIARRKEECSEGSFGRGIGFAQYKNAMTRVAVAMELVVSHAAAIRLRHALIVADAGRVVDPDGLRSQLEGGVIHGASWALCEEVNWAEDGRECLDWDSYPVLRFDNIPTMEVHLIEGADHPSVGAGEASSPPAAAAVANAISCATGLRLRRMPFTSEAIMQEALQQ